MHAPCRGQGNLSGSAWCALEVSHPCPCHLPVNHPSRNHLMQAAVPDALGALAAGGAVDDDDLRYNSTAVRLPSRTPVQRGPLPNAAVPQTKYPRRTSPLPQSQCCRRTSPLLPAHKPTAAGAQAHCYRHTGPLPGSPCRRAQGSPHHAGSRTAPGRPAPQTRPRTAGRAGATDCISTAGR